MYSAYTITFEYRSYMQEYISLQPCRNPWLFSSNSYITRLPNASILTICSLLLLHDCKSLDISQLSSWEKYNLDRHGNDPSSDRHKIAKNIYLKGNKNKLQSLQCNWKDRILGSLNVLCESRPQVTVHPFPLMLNLLIIAGPWSLSQHAFA